MEQKNSSKGTPDQKIAHKARLWRNTDKALIYSKDQETKDREFVARQELRKTIDDARES